MLSKLPKWAKAKRSISIKWKIATITAFSSAVALMLAFEFLIVYDLTVFQKSLDKDLTSLAQVIGSNSTLALDRNDEKSATKALSALQVRKEIVAAALYDASGKILARYLRGSTYASKLPATPQANGTRISKGAIDVFQSVRQQGQTLGYVFLSSNTSAWTERLQRYIWIVSVALLGSTILAFLVAWLLQRTISSPIVTLVHTMRRVSSQKNYALRATGPSDDEIGGLVDGFNEMLAEIQERDAALQQANESLEMRVKERTEQLEKQIQERVRAEEEIVARNQELLALHRISQIDVSRSNLSALQEIVDEISDSTQYPLVSVEIYDKRRQMMVFQAATGPREGEIIKEVSADESLSGTVARSGSPLVQVAKDGESEYILKAAGVKTFICMPMAGPEGVIGTLSLAHVNAVEPEPRLLRWVESLANYLGFVIERQRSAERIRISEERTRKIIETALDAVVTVDTEGRIIGWNKRAEAIFGWEECEIEGRRILETIIPDTSSANYQTFASFLNAYDPNAAGMRVELTGVRKDGNEVPIEIAVSPVKTAEAHTFTAFIRDITDRKAADQELARARDAALEGARLKSEFLANMSHEIRTPMNGVIGMTDLLLDSELTDEQKDYASTIRNSAEALLTVINDILDFSKIEAGKMSIDMTETRLRSIVEDVTELLAPVAHNKGVELLCSVFPEVPEIVKADPVRIRQVVSNLVGNAVKFTDSGEVAVTCDLIEDNANRAIVRISVRDTGIGIPNVGLETIFESFTQVDGSTTRKFGGTGLGLTICRQLVSLMNGKIGVESAIGRGSTFWIEIPVEKIGQPPQPLLLPKGLQGARILIVDDNATNRFILQEQLRQWGAETVIAQSGASALEELTRAEKPFAVAVLDMQMPNMDGLQTALGIRDMHLPAKPKLILLSSIGEQYSRRELVEQGFDACLTKPVRQSQLYNAIIELLTGVPSHAGMQLHDPEQVPSTNTSLKVLLAEDNVVNRKVATKLLDRQGHVVTCAQNGVEAVKLVTMQRFDVVLMDVQMPEMDGLEATAAIRQFELDTGSHIPIVAMTAHVMKGDRERCLAAGMDDYVGKPITPEKLRKALQPYQRVVQQGTGRSENDPREPIDEKYLLEVTNGDAEFIAELTSEFTRTGPELLVAIALAVKDKNFARIKEDVHSLKGCSASLGARSLARVCQDLETAINAEDIHAVERLYVEAEFRLSEAIMYLEDRARKEAA